jgi:hypothetical protein
MTLTLIVYTFLIAAAIALTICARRFRQQDQKLQSRDPDSFVRIIGPDERPYDWQEGDRDAS